MKRLLIMDTAQSVEGSPVSVKVTLYIAGGVTAVNVIGTVAPLGVTVTVPEAGLAV
jgi:hypothetical protein